MNLEIAYNDFTTTFDKLMPGDVFDYLNIIYIKIDRVEYNAVALRSGATEYLKPKCCVELIPDAKMVGTLHSVENIKED